MGDRALSVAGAKLWNALLRELHQCQTLTAFKNNFKTHLIKQAHPWVKMLFMFYCID